MPAKTKPTKAPSPKKVKPLTTQRQKKLSRNAITLTNIGEGFIPSTVISTDMGNGYGEIWHVADDGEVRYFSLPHGRIPVTGDLFDSEVAIDRQHQLDWFEWLGKEGFAYDESPTRYGYGEGVWRLTMRSPEQHRNDPDRYGGDLHLSQIMLGIRKLGIPSGSKLTLIIPMPPGLLKKSDDGSESLVKRVRRIFREGEDGAGEGKWSVRLPDDDDWVTYYVENIGIVPEGLGAAWAYRQKMDGKPAPLNHFNPKVDDMAGLFEIHDGGFGTYDLIQFRDGVLTPDNLVVATDPTGGIQEHLARPILEWAVGQTGVTSLTEMHIDAWLREWVLNGFRPEAAVQLVGNTELQMDGMFARLANQYAAWVCQYKIGPRWKQGVNAIGQGGGMWTYIDNYVTAKYPKDKLLKPGYYDHINWCPTRSLNAYGQLVYFAELLRG